MLVPVVTILTPLLCCGHTLSKGCSTTRVNGVPVALVGDKHHCTTCGQIGVVEPLQGAFLFNPEGKEIATFRHKISCCHQILGNGDPTCLVDV